MTTNLSEAKFEIRMSDDVKSLLLKAAALEGMSLSAFVLDAATLKADEVLENYSNIKLSAQGQMNLVQLLQNPGQPTEAMKELMSMRNLND